MNYKLLPILFIIISLSCQATTNQAYDQDKRTGASKSSPQPTWVDNPSTLFSKSMFITAVGEGKMRKAAVADAIHALSAQFSIDVKGEDVVINTRIIESNGDKPQAFVHSESTSGIKIKVNLELSGVNTERAWEDKEKGVYYALALLERAPILTKLNGQIQQTQEAIIELQNDGMRLGSDKKILKAISRFLRAETERKKLGPIIQIYQFVKNDHTPYPLNEELLTPLELENRAASMISGLNIVTVSGDNQEARTGESLPKPLVVKVVSRGEETIPMKNIPLIFQYQKGSGEMEEEKITDENGIVSNKIFEVKESEEKNHLISVKLNKKSLFFNIDPNHPLLKQLDNKKRLFSYKIQKPKGWEEGILSLAQDLIKRLDDNLPLKVEKVFFRDLRSKERMPFSELIEGNMIRHLMSISKVYVVVSEEQKKGKRTRDLSFTEEESVPAESQSVEITGFFTETPGGDSVRINATLESRSSSGQREILGAGVVKIKSEDIDPADFKLIHETTPLPEIQAQQTEPEDDYNITVEWLLALKQENPQFDFKMSTDKGEYEICAPKACDKVNIFVKSERSGYLYLFDIGTSGNLWMLFPNERMNKLNYIKAGQEVMIPDDYWGSPIWVHEPKGLERIKAILTPKPVNWGALDKTSGFKRLKRNNKKGLRDLSNNMNQLTNLYPDMVEATVSFFIRRQGEKALYRTRAIKTPSSR